MTRKIIDFKIVERQKQLFALCDDGTLWFVDGKDKHNKSKWQQVLDIPTIEAPVTASAFPTSGKDDWTCKGHWQEIQNERGQDTVVFVPIKPPVHFIGKKGWMRFSPTHD